MAPGPQSDPCSGGLGVTKPVAEPTSTRSASSRSTASHDQSDIQGTLRGAGLAPAGAAATELEAGPRRGSAAFRAALEEVIAGADSTAEAEFINLIKSSDLPSDHQPADSHPGRTAAPAATHPRRTGPLVAPSARHALGQPGLPHPAAVRGYQTTPL